MTAEITNLQEPPAQPMDEPESGAAEENAATEVVAKAARKAEEPPEKPAPDGDGTGGSEE